MRALRVFPVLFIVVLVQLIPVYLCFASPSWDFYPEGDDMFDDWDVCRTRGDGEDGFLQLAVVETHERIGVEFRPVIAFESLGEYTDIAYRWGEEFAEKYPDSHQRAEKIFYFVRDRIQYRPDIDRFGIEEFAQNADEVANTIEKRGSASADCEEMAILLAVMYHGAGYRSAVTWCPGHVAAVVQVPSYEKANVMFTVNDEPGWVWAEATGSTNAFGWFPQGQIEGPMLAYEISAEPIARVKPAILAWNLSTFNFSATQGGQNPASQTLEISNSGYGTIEWSVTDNAAWLTPSPTSGTSTGEADDVTFSVDILGMSAGSYSAAVTISALGATNSPQTVWVSLDVAPIPSDASPLIGILIFLVVVGLMVTIILLRRRRRA